VPAFCRIVRQRWVFPAWNVKRRLASVVTSVQRTIAITLAGTADSHCRATRKSRTLSAVPTPPTSA